MNRAPIKEWVVVSCFACLISGCEVPEQDQAGVVEANAIAQIQRDLKSYENNHPGVPITNMLQLFLNTTNSPWGYPHKIEEQLRSLKQGPGFTNSIYERYVLIPRGISNQGFIGEAVLMSAQPFADWKGNPTRMVISRRGLDYLSSSHPEPLIQQIILKAGIEILRPTPLPTPPAPLLEQSRVFQRDDSSAVSLSTRAKNFLNQFGRRLGLGDGHWMTLAFSLGLILFLGLFAGVSFIRRGRQRS